MPRNGSGSYSLPAGNPVVTGTTISSTWANTTLNDIASALTASLANDGQTPATANLPMGGFKHTNVASGTALTDYARADQVQNGALQWLTSVSGVDTITASAPIAPSAYAAGQVFRFVAAGANTGAVTLNVNSLGARSVTKNGAVALVAGDIPNASIVTVCYDGTQFQLLDANRVTSLSMATARLAGRSTAGTGAVEEITVGSGLSLSAGSLTATVAAVASTAEVQTGTDNTKAVTPASLRGGAIVLAGAAVATTSGTSVSLTTAIPTWARKVTIALNGVSTNGTSAPLIQIGPTAAVETSGYAACSHSLVNNVGFSAVDSSAGFPINSQSAAHAISGSFVLTLMDSATNTWAIQGCVRTASSTTAFTGGVKALAGALARVTLTTAGGVDTFDAGSANVIWE